VAELETFLESRKLTPDYRPMRELIHTLDGPNMGPAPGPWQVGCSRSLSLALPRSPSLSRLSAAFVTD